MKKSFKQLASEITPLEEQQEGVLRGGFSSYSVPSSLSEEKNKNGCVNVNCGSGTDCSD